jgi:hypothetical protein
MKQTLTIIKIKNIINCFQNKIKKRIKNFPKKPEKTKKCKKKYMTETKKNTKPNNNKPILFFLSFGNHHPCKDT